METLKKIPMTSQGKAWFVSAMDPFHDYRLDLEGFPDLNGGMSNVQLYQETVSVAAPVAANWDCLVFATGLDSITTIPTPMTSVSVANWQYAEYDSGTNATANWGSYVVMSVPAGTPMFPIGGTHTIQYLHGRNQATPGRTIACAFEAHNTTATLHKQGSVVCGQQNFARSDYSARLKDTNAAPLATYDSVTRLMCGPPRTVAEATSIPGSSQWEAGKGCYVIPRLESFNLAIEALEHRQAAYRTRVVAAGGADSLLVYQSVGTSGTDYVAHSACSTNEFECGFAFFSGLSAESTIQVTSRTITEYFPVPGDILLSSATPSPAFDPIAIEVYGMAISQVPFAVPVGMNSAGDYFRMVLGAISKIAPVIATAIPHPAIKAIAGAVGGGAGMLSGLLERKRQPEKEEGTQVVRLISGPPAVAVESKKKTSSPVTRGVKFPKFRK
jgi:hypothetical protein